MVTFPKKNGLVLIAFIDNRYYYTCGSTVNGMSSTFHFSTAPPVGSRNPMNIVVYGDEGIFEFSYTTVAQVSALVTRSSLQPNFIYHLGDFGYGNDRDTMWYEYSWNLFFEQNQLFMPIIPYMTLPGILWCLFLPWPIILLTKILAKEITRKIADNTLAVLMLTISLFTIIGSICQMKIAEVQPICGTVLIMEMFILFLSVQKRITLPGILPCSSF